MSISLGAGPLEVDRRCWTCGHGAHVGMPCDAQRVASGSTALLPCTCGRGRRRRGSAPPEF